MLFSLMKIYKSGKRVILSKTTPLKSTIVIKVDLYDLVIFDHFWPSDWRGKRDEF